MTITYELKSQGKELQATVESMHNGQSETFILPFKRGKRR